MSTLLVTGANGFIGRRLLGPGTRGLVRQSGVLAGAAEEALGDLLDPTSLRAACAGIASIVHCAGQAHVFGVADPATQERVNHLGTRNLLEAAAACGVRRFVLLSSVKAMAEPGTQCVDEDWPGTPDTAYGAAKRAAEEAVLACGARHGMHVVNLRLAMGYGRGGRGNLERLAQALRRGWFPPLPDTGNRRSLVHVDDIVSAIQHVLADARAGGRTYIVAHPRPCSTFEMIGALRAGLGLRPQGPALPAALWRGLGRAGDWAGVLARRRLPLDSEVVSRLFDSACYRPDRIERELGWRARVDLATGVREMLGTAVSPPAVPAPPPPDPAAR